jgi:hypothetical protein
MSKAPKPWEAPGYTFQIPGWPPRFTPHEQRQADANKHDGDHAYGNQPHQNRSSNKPEGARRERA